MGLITALHVGSIIDQYLEFLHVIRWAGTLVEGRQKMVRSSLIRVMQGVVLRIESVSFFCRYHMSNVEWRAASSFSPAHGASQKRVLLVILAWTR